MICSLQSCPWYTKSLPAFSPGQELFFCTSKTFFTFCFHSTYAKLELADTNLLIHWTWMLWVQRVCLSCSLHGSPISQASSLEHILDNRQSYCPKFHSETNAYLFSLLKVSQVHLLLSIHVATSLLVTTISWSLRFCNGLLTGFPSSRLVTFKCILYPETRVLSKMKEILKPGLYHLDLGSGISCHSQPQWFSFSSLNFYSISHP